MSPSPIVSQISTLEVSVSVTAGVTLTSLPAVQPLWSFEFCPQSTVFHMAATGGRLVLTSCADSLLHSQLLLCSAPCMPRCGCSFLLAVMGQMLLCH